MLKAASMKVAISARYPILALLRICLKNLSELSNHEKTRNPYCENDEHATTSESKATFPGRVAFESVTYKFPQNTNHQNIRNTPYITHRPVKQLAIGTRCNLF